uniref:MFS domain-containing protein n=1 Tax=Rhabditophanes sp. KR3021 TaxID=114890 RepID=A0AC35UH80_9BILA
MWSVIILYHELDMLRKDLGVRKRAACADKAKHESGVDITWTENEFFVYDKLTPSIGHTQTIAEFQKKFKEAVTDWQSIYLVYVMLFFCGVQVTVFFTSMWPYLQALTPNARVETFGICVACFSLGQTIGSPVFGIYSSKTKSTKNPVCVGLCFVICGNFMYSLLPSVPDSMINSFMIFSRLLVGFGSGTTGVLRSYNATACTQNDRKKVISTGIGALCIGATLGPVIQIIFNPLGGYNRKFLLFLTVNQFTAPAFVMCLFCLVSIIFFKLTFKETFIGIEENDDISTENNKVEVPPFDKLAITICIFNWICLQSMATNIEVLASPWTIAMYNWNDSEAILYNGIILAMCSLTNFGNFMLQAYSCIIKLDSRHLINFGLIAFIGYNVVNFPMFYSEKLDYIPLIENTTIENTKLFGGCSRNFSWCESSNRIPLPVYIASMIICLGMGFPSISGPNGVVFSNCLGPRRQSGMQSMMEFFGCIARGVGPLIISILFQMNGPLYCVIFQGIIMLIALIMNIVFRNRLVPLTVKVRE